MGDRLKELRERSQKRRQLLAQQYGLQDPESLRDVLKSKDEQEELTILIAKKRVSDIADEPESKKSTLDKPQVLDTSKGLVWHAPWADGEPGGEADKAPAEEEEKEEIYTDSSAFLKGTQSENPHNDYCQHHVDTGERPQNFIRDVGLANRFEEYPKLRELIRLKDELIQKTNTPPMYLKCDLQNYYLHDLDSKFDVIMVEPPLEEYQRTAGVTRDKYWNWDELQHLEIEQIAAERSFLWLWCGSSDGLDGARNCLKKWGFRRCEDICWIKTNIKNPGHNKNVEPRAAFQRTKEHCLMGIRGTVRRSVDGDFIHANVDIDLIIEDEPPYGSDEKPVEIFHIIEHFCLGRRRLHVFGRDSTIRPGWLSIGTDLTSSNFDAQTYKGYFNKTPDGYTTGCPEEIERLRPKSPPAKSKDGKSDGKGRGRGGGNRGGMSRGGMQHGGGAGWSGKGAPPRGGAFGGRGRGGHRGGQNPR